MRSSPPPPLFSTDVDPATLDAGWTGIMRRRRRARNVRRTLLAIPVVLALALSVSFVVGRWRGKDDAPALQAIALAGGGALPRAWSAEAPSTVELDDGSRLELAAGARLGPRDGRSEGDRVDLVLEGGAVTFDVKPGGLRPWTIEAGETRVRVLGTRFTVARDGEHVHVAVERGKVRVESAHLPAGARDLVAGEELDVAPPQTSGVPDAGAAGVVTAARDLSDAPAPPVAGTVTRRSEPTSHTTSPAPPSAGTADSGAQASGMELADAARRAGRSRDAVAILSGVVDRREPDAALAAFTVGKIHSEELGDVATAAAWFERAIELGLGPALEEDAYARVVECHARAGHAGEASGAAARYRARFPAGRHLARVRRWASE